MTTSDTSTPRTMTARTPEDLLAVVPVVLGFEPADSAVMLVTGGGPSMQARVDLPEAPGADRALEALADSLTGPAVRHGATAVVLLLYTPHRRLARAACRRLRRRFDDEGIRIVDVLRAHGGRWFPILHDPGGVGDVGVPYDVSAHPFVAEAVMDGRVLHGSREELAASLQSFAAGVAEVDAARPGEPATVAWLEATVARHARRGTHPTATEAARLLEGLADPVVRDAAWLRLQRATARRDVHLWCDLVRRAPDDLVPHAAAVLAMASWVAGDGALAWCAVDRARELDRDHSLAGLVADLLLGAVSPAEWDEMAASLRSAS